MDSRKNGRMYADDHVIRVKGIGKKAEGLLKRNGIKTVANLRALTKEIRPEGLTTKALKQYLTNCKDALSENAPSITYYTEADNPFAARYGEEEDDWGQPEWISKIKSSTVFKHQVCVTDLVKHIVKQKKCYQNTEHSDTYMFYHDASSLLTANQCVEWMKKQKIPGEELVVYDRWIKPELGLNNHISMFGGRPPGYSPKLMPLDNSLNQDIHESAKKTQPFVHGNSYARCFQQMLVLDDNAKGGSTLL